jgi:hypothetical protein
MHFGGFRLNWVQKPGHFVLIWVLKEPSNIQAGSRRNTQPSGLVQWQCVKKATFECDGKHFVQPEKKGTSRIRSTHLPEVHEAGDREEINEDERKQRREEDRLAVAGHRPDDILERLFPDDNVKEQDAARKEKGAVKPDSHSADRVGRAGVTPGHITDSQQYQGAQLMDSGIATATPDTAQRVSLNNPSTSATARTTHTYRTSC